MKIMFLNGGLANQTFQYIFYRYGQLVNRFEEWYLDDSFFFVNNVHNGYELQKVFGLRPNLLSEYFDRDVWNYMMEQKRLGKSVPEQLLENDIEIRMIAEYDNWRQWNPFSGKVDQLDQEYEDWMVNIKGNIYYSGYGIKEEYFRKIERVLREELVFPEIDEENNLEYLKEIRNSNSCAMHVRRGDFVKIGSVIPDHVHSYTIDEMLKREPDITVFLFSDDLGYCKRHWESMGLDKPKKVVFVKGNSGAKAFRDIQLMSLCRHMIVGNSSFSFLASLLNKEKGITLGGIRG